MILPVETWQFERPSGPNQSEGDWKGSRWTVWQTILPGIYVHVITLSPPLLPSPWWWLYQRPWHNSNNVCHFSAFLLCYADCTLLFDIAILLYDCHDPQVCVHIYMYMHELFWFSPHCCAQVYSKQKIVYMYMYVKIALWLNEAHVFVLHNLCITHMHVIHAWKLIRFPNLRGYHPIACSGKPNPRKRQSHLGA